MRGIVSLLELIFQYQLTKVLNFYIDIERCNIIPKKLVNNFLKKFINLSLFKI